MRIENMLEEYASRLEEALPGYLPRCPAPESRVGEAMAYSLLGGGKRVRGALTLAFYRLYKEDLSPALPYAGALEMIHAYSLIHDDLPCMDDDDLRRGKPSCHIAFGEAVALLAGDGLLTLAFETMCDPAHADAFPAATVLEAVRQAAWAAGCSGMIGGQMIDLAGEGSAGTTAALLDRMYAKKTGALIVAAARLGCILGGASKQDLDAASDYARYLGLAFQIVDDLLDAAGDEAVLGKPVGSDAANGKSTYVRMYGEDAARREVDKLNLRARQALEKLEGDTRFLAGLADLLAARQH